MKRYSIIFALLLLVYVVTGQNKDYNLYFKTEKKFFSENIDNTTSLSSIVSQDKNMLWNGNFYGIIQFRQLPTDKTKNMLKKHGVEFEDYIPNNAFLVSFPKNLDLSFLKNAGIRALIPFSSKYKIEPVLLDNTTIPDNAWTDDNNVKLLVAYHNNLTINNFEQDILAKFGVSPEDKNEKYKYFSIEIPFNKIEEFASLPYVKYVQDAPGEYVPDDSYNNGYHSLDVVHAPARYNLQGEGVTVAMSDYGNPVENIDFKGRINADDYGSSYVQGRDSHGDHTAGIVASAGNFNELYQGTAPKCNLIVFEGSGATAAADANPDIVITSISLGSGVKSCKTFGRYNQKSRTQDLRTNQLPYLLECYSAGNENEWSCVPGERGMYGLNEGEASAKNTLTVGGLFNKNVYSYNMYINSSSRGPTADRRIKPEITALGEIVSNVNFNEYAEKTGSSQATPAVAGTAVLLYELYRKKHNNDNPESALIKAVLCNTAEDCDNNHDNYRDNPGPDFSSGFGFLNAYRAIKAIDSSWFTSVTLDNNQQQDIVINVPQSTGKLKVMICWNDPAAAAFASQALVNNVDLEVYSPNDSLFQPWVLDTAFGHLETPAVRGVDNINNIEQVTIDNPASGNYTIKVKGTHIPSGPQKVWISYYFVEKEICEFVTPITGTSYVPGEQNVVIAYETNKDSPWDGGFSLQVTYDDGASWQEITNLWKYGIAQTYWQYDIPEGIQTGKARFKINFNNMTALSDYFSVMNIPLNVRALFSENGQTGLKWDSVTGAVEYRIWKLGDKFMEPIGTTTDTYFVAENTDHSQDNYFAVQALGPNDAESRRSKPVIVYAGQFNAASKIITQYPFKESFEGEFNPVYFGSFSHYALTDNGDYRFHKGYGNAGYSTSGPTQATDAEHYAYLRADYNYNKPFCLLSPVFDFSNLDSPKLTFDYNMYGEDMGTLKIEITDDDGANWTTIFEKSGDQGNKWYRKRISLPNYQGKIVYFKITGISGDHRDTEMAIDNFIVDDEKAVEAEFYTFNRKIKVNDTIQFNNLSSDNTTSWMWVFEGANTDTSYQENPRVVYNNPGVYKVELTATADEGSDTHVKRGYINVTADGYYCVPQKIYAGLSWIRELQFDELNIYTEKNSYVDLSDMKIHMHTGQNQVTIIKGDAFGVHNNFRRIWIDFNNNGNFESPEEIVYEDNGSGTGTEEDTVLCNVAIPDSISNFVGRMRIVLYNANFIDKELCDGNAVFAELLDITVAVDTAPVANFQADQTVIDAGQSITLSDLSTTNAVSWMWDIENNGTHIYSTAKNPVIVLDNPGLYAVSLTVSNYYGSNTMMKSNYITVNSNCAITSFPYTEDFENGGTLPDCWLNEFVTDTQSWDFRTGSQLNHPNTAHSGSYNATLYNNSSQANITKLVTPELKINNLQNPVLKFWHTQAFWSPDQDYLKLYYKVHADSSWVMIKEWTNDIPDWTQENIALPDKSDHYYLAFEGWAKYGYGVCIDDVTVEEGPTDPPLCTNPVSPLDGAANVDVAANLEWESADNATGYKLFLGTNNPPDNMENGLDVGSTNIFNPTTNFNPNTTYYWKIVPYNVFGDATGCQVWSFTTSGSSCTYCATNYSNTSDDYISKVVFNQINKTSGSTTYSNFTGVSTDVEKGQTYTISVDVTVNGYWTQKVKVWCDWNNNCDFSDDGEAYAIGETPGQKGTFTVSGDITVPQSAINGTVRMRVAEKYYQYPEPCGNNTYGEAEDYNLNITGGSRQITGVNQLNYNNNVVVNVYPNPVNNDIVYVESDNKINEIYVYGVDGTVVLSFTKEQKNKIKLNVGNLSPGMYIMKIITNKQIITQKLIRQ